MSAFKTGLDPRTIGEQRRAKFGDDPFHIVPDKPPKPPVPCTASDCPAIYYPDEGEWRGQCKGWCLYG